VRATPLLQTRVVIASDACAEVVVWRLPRTHTGSRHRLKYRLAYVVAGECVVRYDNEQAKGDHKHYGTAEEAYHFSTPERLIADFARDIERWNREHGRP